MTIADGTFFPPGSPSKDWDEHIPRIFTRIITELSNERRRPDDYHRGVAGRAAWLVGTKLVWSGPCILRANGRDQRDARIFPRLMLFRRIPYLRRNQHQPTTTVETDTPGDSTGIQWTAVQLLWHPHDSRQDTRLKLRVYFIQWDLCKCWVTPIFSHYIYYRSPTARYLNLQSAELRIIKEKEYPYCHKITV